MISGVRVEQPLIVIKMMANNNLNIKNLEEEAAGGASDTS
jgi:hypothetical protein